MPKFMIPLPGETLVAQTHPSWWKHFGTVFLGILLTPVVGIGLFMLLWVLICVKTTCYVATNARVVSKTGWLNTKQTEVRIADIRGVDIKRTFLQRILGIGDIEIGSAATEGAEIVMRGVVDPEGFVRAVNAQRPC